MPTTDLSTLPEDLFQAIVVAKERMTMIKATIKVGEVRAVGNNNRVCDLTISFLDRPQTAEQGKNVWKYLKYTLWGDEAVITSTRLLEYADTEGRLQMLIAFDFDDITEDKAYTNRSGETVQPYKFRKLFLFHSDFFLALGEKNAATSARSLPQDDELPEDEEEV